MTSGDHGGLTENTEEVKGFMGFVEVIEFYGVSIRGENGVPSYDVSLKRYVEQLACGGKRGAFSVHGNEVVG